MVIKNVHNLAITVPFNQFEKNKQNKIVDRACSKNVFYLDYLSVFECHKERITYKRRWKNEQIKSILSKRPFLDLPNNFFSIVRTVK